MPTQITISSISGLSPYDLYLCDNPITTCIWVDTITSASLPYTFDVPSIMENQTSFNLKVVDDNNCQVITYLDTTTPITCPEYLGYDLYPGSCWELSPDFFIKLPVVLEGGLPCEAGKGAGIPGLKNCPLGTIEYSINGGSPLSFTAATFGGFSCGYTLAGCDCTILKLEGPTGIFLGGYSGQTVTIDYTGTYPSTPPLSFTETFVINVPLICT